MEDKLPKCLIAFRNSHGTQHLLVTMLGKRKKAVDLGECVSKLFLDLSKAFDTINHDRLLAKLRAYGFSLDALKLTHSYLIESNKFKLTMNSSLKTMLSLGFNEAL